MSKEESKKWIIGCSGSDWDDVVVYSFEGTKDQAKQVLADIVKADKKDHPDIFLDGTTRKSDVNEYKDGRLYACAMFSEHHNDYTATLAEDIQDIKSWLK